MTTIKNRLNKADLHGTKKTGMFANKKEKNGIKIIKNS